MEWVMSLYKESLFVLDVLHCNSCMFESLSYFLIVIKENE